VKLNFKYKDLFKYWSTFHKSTALFPGQGVVVMQDYKNDDFFHLELLVQCVKSIIWICTPFEEQRYLFVTSPL
jgi:hypothetical protein